MIQIIQKANNIILKDISKYLHYNTMKIFSYFIGILSMAFVLCNNIYLQCEENNIEQCYDHSLGYANDYPLVSHDIYNQTINDFDLFLGYSNTTLDEPSYIAVEILARRLVDEDNNTLRAVHDDIPSIIDYRNINEHNKYNSRILTSVKYQGRCGTCVAFAALGVLESEFLKKDIHLDLSEKDIYFCNSERNCDDGWYLHGITQKLLYDGVVAENYCPYDVLTFICHPSCNHKHKFKISDFRYINKFYNMRKWLAYNGTLLTRLNVYSDFYYYRNGVYEKGSDNLRGAHAVMVVGYNDIEKYWIAKNSWGDDWGMDGFFHIKYGHAGMMPYSYGYIIDINDMPPTPPSPYSTSANINCINIILIFLICHLNLRI